MSTKNKLITLTVLNVLLLCFCGIFDPGGDSWEWTESGAFGEDSEKWIKKMRTDATVIKFAPGITLSQVDSLYERFHLMSFEPLDPTWLPYDFAILQPEADVRRIFTDFGTGTHESVLGNHLLVEYALPVFGYWYGEESGRLDPSSTLTNDITATIDSTAVTWNKLLAVMETYHLTFRNFKHDNGDDIIIGMRVTKDSPYNCMRMSSVLAAKHDFFIWVEGVRISRVIL